MANLFHHNSYHAFTVRQSPSSDTNRGPTLGQMFASVAAHSDLSSSKQNVTLTPDHVSEPNLADMGALVDMK